MLAKNAAIDFYKTTGLPGSAGGAHDSGYSAETSLQPLHCEGGDPTVSCQSNFPKWAASLKEAPILLDFELAPISDLVEDPGTKKALESAVQDYVTERKAAWAALSKCPHTCGGVGSCGSGGSVCSCTRPGRVGRMCSGCAPVSVKGTFVDILGQEHSGVATVACNGQFVAAWSGSAKCTVFGDSTGGTCPGAAYAYCARTSDGSLQTKLEQKQCTAQNTGTGDNFPCGGFSSSSGGDSTSAREAAPPPCKKYFRCPTCVTGGKPHWYPCEVKSMCEYA